ncbi:MAG: phosphotransferase [Solirubrobacterales bacterium]
MSEISEIVDRLAPVLGQPVGEAVPLDGGITNRNYKVSFGGDLYVVRVPGKDTGLLEIDRYAELAASELAAEAGVAPKVAAMLEDPPCLVAEFLGARTMTPEELRRPEFIVDVAADLRGIHNAGQSLPNRFSAFRIVETYAETAADRGATVPHEYEQAQENARRIEAALQGPEHVPVPCHNDLLAANFLHDGDRLWIVVWEYAGMGDRYFDLGNFAVNNELSVDDEFALLTAYFDERPRARRMAALGLMRFMSDFREAMWGVVQSAISAIEFDFTDYASKHFDRLRVQAADPRFDRWIEEAGE